MAEPDRRRVAKGFTYDELSSGDCPPALREFVALQVEWKRGAQEGKLAAHLNDAEGRRAVARACENLATEASVVPGEPVEWWITGLHGRPDEADEIEAFKRKHGIPDAIK